MNHLVDFITLIVERFWSLAKQPLNREGFKITLQIERDIRSLAFCWFIIIFISLVAVHFYCLILN